MVSLGIAEIPIHLEGQLGGSSQAIAISERSGIAYLGVGPRVVTLDISDPNEIRQIAQSEVLPEVVEDVVVRDGYVYVADGYAGLVILDASDANTPSVVGRWSHLEGYTTARGRSVRLFGDYAYFADGSEGLHIIDVSHPTKPGRIGGVTTVYPKAVAVTDGYAFVDSYAEGVTVIDVSDPTQPRTLPQSEVLPQPTAMEIVGNLLYASGAIKGESGLYVIDAHDPARLSWVGRCRMNYPEGLVIAEEMAYVTNRWNGLDIIDLADPALPAHIGSYKTQGAATAVAVCDRGTCIATDYGGLEIVDVSSPTAPVPFGMYATTNFGDIAVAGSYAYLTSAYTGMQIVDVSDRAAPSYVSWLDLTYANAVELGKGHICVADGWDFLAVDVTHPWEPLVMGAHDLGQENDDLVVVDRHVYLATNRNLAILDVVNPRNPVQVGWCDVSGSSRGVCILDGYAYVAHSEGLDIIDVSDPCAPLLVSCYSDDIGVFQVAVVDGFAYLANANSGLRILDVSDPYLSEYVARYDTYYAHDIVIRDQFALLLDYRDGLQIIDISDPDSLVSVGACDVPGYAMRLAVVDDYAYVACSSGGLAILKIDWSGALEPKRELDNHDP